MVDIEEILVHIKQEYGLVVIACSKLEGYGSINYKIKTDDDQSYVLKVYLNSRELKLAIAENEVLLKANSSPIEFPKPKFSKSDQHYQTIKSGISYRLLSYLNGSFIAEIEHDGALLRSFGTQLANSTLQLSNVYQAEIAAKIDPWNLNYFLSNHSLLNYIDDAQDKALALYFFDQYETFVYKKLLQLPCVTVQNDFNDWNVLVNENKVTGLIDFGDIAYAPKINHIAIGLFYILLNKESPLDTALIVLQAYHKIDPLEPQELELLFYLIAARAVTSVCNSAKAKLETKDDSYISITEKPAWVFLKQWISISPVKAKNEFLKVIGQTQSEDSRKDLINKRHKYFSSAMSLSYETPIHMESAAFQYMFDAKGNTYLDAYNNIPIVGHCHPRISVAAAQQIKMLNTNTRYLYDHLTAYAEHLLSYFPSSFDKVFFVNSGSAANDLAARIAMNYNRHSEFVVMDHGYHGNTQIGIDISAYKFDGKGGDGQKPNIHKLEMPKLYNGKYDTVKEYVSTAEHQLNRLQNDNKRIAGLFVEPIIGCGGQVPIPKAYLNAISAKIKSCGGLVICDEVQIGFGRLGKWFWGFEMLTLIPDIVVLGKPMGNGHPIAAVVTRSDITERFESGMEFFSSFGGNPVSCVVAKTVLEIIEDEQLQQAANETGNYFKRQLKDLATVYSNIGDIRGEGLFLGIEIVDPLTLKPDTLKAKKIKNFIKNNFILTSTDGPFNNVLKIKPPLCFNNNNVDQYCEYLIKAINNS